MATKEEVIKLLRGNKSWCEENAHIFDEALIKSVDDIKEGAVCRCGQTKAHWVIRSNGHRFLTTIWIYKTIEELIRR